MLFFLHIHMFIYFTFTNQTLLVAAMHCFRAVFMCIIVPHLCTCTSATSWTEEMARSLSMDWLETWKSILVIIPRALDWKRCIWFMFETLYSPLVVYRTSILVWILYSTALSLSLTYSQNTYFRPINVLRASTVYLCFSKF